MQFKTFERKATRLAGQVAQKGSELLEAGKTKLAIGKEEHAIDELYYKIGEAVYQQSVAGEEVPAYAKSDVEEIKEHFLRIESLKKGKKNRILPMLPPMMGLSLIVPRNRKTKNKNKISILKRVAFAALFCMICVEIMLKSVVIYIKM